MESRTDALMRRKKSEMKHAKLFGIQMKFQGMIRWKSMDVHLWIFVDYL